MKVDSFNIFLQSSESVIFSSILSLIKKNCNRIISNSLENMHKKAVTHHKTVLH